MTLPDLVAKHNIDPESAKAFLREWLDMQPILMRFSDSTKDIKNAPVIARPTDLGE